MLGEQGTEQFTVSTYQDGDKIGEQQIHDPFIRTTIRICISRWDLFKAMFRKQYETKINVCVNGTDGMVRTIMTLDPEKIAQETKIMQEARAKSRYDRPTVGYVADQQQSASG